MNDVIIRKGLKALALNQAMITCTTEDGEVLEVSIPPGPCDLGCYMPLLNYGELDYHNLIVQGEPLGRVRSIKTGAHWQTAANPDFKPAAADRAGAMQAMINRAVRRGVKAITRQKALADKPGEKPLEKQAPPKPDPVIEKEGNPDDQAVSGGGAGDADGAT